MEHSSIGRHLANQCSRGRYQSCSFVRSLQVESCRTSCWVGLKQSDVAAVFDGERWTHLIRNHFSLQNNLWYIGNLHPLAVSARLPPSLLVPSGVGQRSEASTAGGTGRFYGARCRMILLEDVMAAVVVTVRYIGILPRQGGLNTSMAPFRHFFSPERATCDQ